MKAFSVGYFFMHNLNTAKGKFHFFGQPKIHQIYCFERYRGYFYMAAVAIIGSTMFCQKKAFTQESLWAQPASILEVDVPSLNLCGQ